MKPSKISVIAVLPACLLLAGCASVVSGTKQSMFVETPKVAGASCRLTDSKDGTWYLPVTPGSVTVQKGDGPMNVVCEKEGYETASIAVEEELAGATFGNVILGGGIGVFVDAMTGAAQKYPDKVVVWMKPETFDTEEQEAAWLEEKTQYEEELAAKRKEEQEKVGPQEN